MSALAKTDFAEQESNDHPSPPQLALPDGELIGMDCARASIAWIREHAGPVLTEAEQLLAERYPGAETKRSVGRIGGTGSPRSIAAALTRL